MEPQVIAARTFSPVPAATEAHGGAVEAAAYAYDDDIVLALNVALATGRPLLLSGPPGSGKSSLGLDVAYRMRWRYYQELLGPATVARDLCYAVLEQPAAGGAAAVVPGVLWWAFDPVGAAAQLARVMPVGPGDHPGVHPRGAGQAPAVVLLDDLDRAPADLPAALVDVLWQTAFAVPATGAMVRAASRPLIIMTASDVRPLPAAFRDRCVLLTLGEPDREKLLRVGQAHFPRASVAVMARAADALLSYARERGATIDTRDYVALLADVSRSGVEPEQSPAWRSIAHAVEKRRRRGPPPKPARRAKPEVRVFISYAREDEAVARRLYDDLRRHGHTPWLDLEALVPGQNWRSAIERAIRESALFLALLSAHSVSKTGYVQKEMREAVRFLEEMPPDTVYIVPVRVDDCEPPHGPLHDLHWVDLFPSYESAFDRILRAIDLVPNQMKELPAP